MKDALIFILKIPVWVYRYVISPLFPPTCRFSPSCSDYCLQALEKHGALAGVWLTFRRIGRCHPWSGKYGFDPVPTCIKCDPAVKCDHDIKCDHDDCDHVTHKQS